MQSASRGDRLCLVSRALFVCSPLFKPVKGQFRQIAAEGAKSFTKGVPAAVFCPIF